jgi:membrane peptidoglycan carboxypeptidase
VEWPRLANAILQRSFGLLDKDRRGPGGSTLATQIEKFRHSPEGRTSAVRDKCIQMASAALKAYLDGPNTLKTRRGIVLDYLNSIPLGAVPGYGEIIGLGDGLWAWYGADFDRLNRCLAARPRSGQDRHAAEWGLAFKQVLSLFLAQRRPSFYLFEKPQALESQTQRYLSLLLQEGILSETEWDAALTAALQPLQSKQAQQRVSFVERKAANAVRSRLLGLLEVPQLYELDRFDLRVACSLDDQIQKEVADILQNLTDPAYARQCGLYGSHLLNPGDDPGKIIYSFTLYEHVSGANLLRVQTDNFDQPLNINESIKLELGSTAKLRTLVTYLEIIAELHARYGELSGEELRAASSTVADVLSLWAIEYLRDSPDRTLPAMLEAAMERSYSASPAEHFFTGGGLHTFANFKPEDDGRVLSVREAFRHSVNLVFIRLMRDVVSYYIYRRSESLSEALADPSDPARKAYLAKFADHEGSKYLRRFYKKYHGLPPREALQTLVRESRMTPKHLTVIYRSVVPEADIDEFYSFIQTALPDSALSRKTLAKLYQQYSPTVYSLLDRGFLARVHPLELWTVAYLRQHPTATINELIGASANERQEVYLWLFKTGLKDKQDQRILIMLENEAFQEIQRAWQRLGYPFDSLIPSFATAIGSSADRPAALAELVGVILNNGVRYPSVRIRELHFAQDTPYETIMRPTMEKGQQVLLPEIAGLLRQELIGVVEYGTAQTIRSALRTPAGLNIAIGGKTGTGDNRYEVYSADGEVITSFAINRTATFVFTIGDRLFGVITAYVPGKHSAAFEFTSSLAVRVLKVLAPKLLPLLAGRPDALHT